MSISIIALDDKAITGHGLCIHMTPEALTVVTFKFEHILPSSLGGATSFENLCLSCPTCNRYKSDRTFGAANEQTRMTALFHPL